MLLAWLYALAADVDRGGAGGISGAVEGGDAEGGAGEGVAVAAESSDRAKPGWRPQMRSPAMTRTTATRKVVP